MKTQDKQLEFSPEERDLGVLVVGKLSMSQKYAVVAKRAKCIRGSIKHGIGNWSKEVIVPLCSALVWPHLEHSVQFLALKYKKDLKILECVQRRTTKMVKGLERCDLGGVAEDTRCVHFRQEETV